MKSFISPVINYSLSTVHCRSKSGKRDSNPRPSAWKADALPLSYSRIKYYNFFKAKITGGEGRIRTSEGRANGFTARPLWPLGYLS